MKKIATFAIASAMCLSLLAGCGNSSNTSTPAASSGAGSSAATAGADWPNKTVTLLCGFGAGGSSDLGVRSLATALEKQTGASFIVQNVTGANGWMAWAQLLQSDADGYTIALVNTPSLFTDYLDPQQGHTETMDNFDFICNHVTDYGMLVCKTGTYSDMGDFMKAAEISGGVTVGDVGANGNKHIATIQLGNANPKTTLTAVHQSGWSDNYAALLGGTLDAVSCTYGDIASVLGDGDLQVLCVFADNRLEQLPDVPTCSDAGYGDIVSAPSRGYMLPQGVDADTKAKIEEVFASAIADTKHQADMNYLGLNINYLGGQDYVDMLKGQEQQIIDLKPELGWN